MNKKILQAILSLSFISILISSCSNHNSKDNVSLSSTNAIAVNVTTATMDSSTNNDNYIGMLEPFQSIPLSFSLPGTIENVYVSEGQAVSAGQKLAEINSETFKNTLSMMEAKEKQAIDAYNRLSKVYKEGSLPEIKYIEIETGVEQAKSSTEIARKNLKDCILKSPCAGVIGKKNIEPGSNGMPMTSAFVIYKIESVYARVPIPENEIHKIKKGEKAKVVISALNNEEFVGTIEEIGVDANMISHTYDIKIKINNSGLKIKPGMVCNVYLSNLSNSPRITVPSNAIVSESGKQYLYVVNSDKNSVQKKEVTVGNFKNNNIVIKDGINAGDEIVISGQQKLFNNAPVSIIQ